MTNRIYRVENRHSLVGMYSRRSPIRGGLIYYGDVTLHPRPQDDDLLVKNSGIDPNEPRDLWPFHFGFSSIEQLYRWIFKNEWLRALSVHGFVINVYEGEEIYHGHTQAIFVRDECELVETIDPQTLQV